MISALPSRFGKRASTRSATARKLPTNLSIILPDIFPGRKFARPADTAKESPETFFRKVFTAVDEFAKTPGGNGQEDDQTIVLINHI